jgi:YegS/Rv2252/BmrU family lipid kinase
MTTFFIIANPVAGRGACAKVIPQVERILEHHEAEFQLVQTAEPWHGYELARAAAQEFDVVVALGGDGTANEVINGLISAKKEGLGSAVLGVIGAGRGNDFADTLAIPDDLNSACRVLLQNQSRPIDIGRVFGGDVPDGRYFGNCLGVGFDAIATIEASKLPRMGGFLSFLLAILKTIILYNKAPVSTVTFDEESVTQPSLMISVMNGSRLGGGFIMAPKAEPDDGLFDLCIAHQVSRRRVLTLLPHFLKGSQASQPEILTGKAASIFITSAEGALPAQTDGEIICKNGNHLRIELLPGELDAICGPLETS